jgi:hypothetical protein
LRWFGTSWLAPVCDPGNHIPTPLGMRCIRCGKGFTLNDQGFEMPYVDGGRVGTVYYHKGCFLREVGVVRDEVKDDEVKAVTPGETPQPTTAEAAKELRDALNKVADERRAALGAAKGDKGRDAKG